MIRAACAISSSAVLAGVSLMISELLLIAVVPVLAQVDEGRQPVLVSGGVSTEFNCCWEVVNLDADPVCEFEIPAHGTYDAEIPPGWQCSADGLRFRVWSTSPDTDLRRGDKESFSLHLKSGWSVAQGRADAIVRTRSGQTIIVPDVVTTRKGMPLGPLPVLGTFGGGLLLMILISRRRGKRAANQAEEPPAEEAPTG
jgi:hypothetical protein